MSDLEDYECNCIIAKKIPKAINETNFADSYQDLTCQLLKHFTVIVCNKCS